MAFKEQNLSCISNNAKIGVVPALWMFWNEANDTVTTAGYIPANYGMKAKDQVVVVDNDGGNAVWYNATVSSGVITLVANA